MNAEDILASLKRMHSELDRIYKSRGLLQLLLMTQEPDSLDRSLGSAMFHLTESKLRVSKILSCQKHKEVA